MSSRARLAALIAATALLAGCTTDAEPPDDAASSATPTPTVAPSDADLDLSALPIPRTDLCPALAEEDVARALDGQVADTAHYRNGEEFEVRPGQVDVSHEYGCVYRSAAGAEARVWVFARPVTVAEARTLVRRARRGSGCSFPESIGFGEPGLTSVCDVDTGPGAGSGQNGNRPRVRARLEGLFGDTWLACEVSEPRAAQGASGESVRAGVVRRADRWCAEVATTVSAS